MRINESIISIFRRRPERLEFSEMKEHRWGWARLLHRFAHNCGRQEGSQRSDKTAVESSGQTIHICKINGETKILTNFPSPSIRRCWRRWRCWCYTSAEKNGQTSASQRSIKNLGVDAAKFLHSAWKRCSWRTIFPWSLPLQAVQSELDKSTGLA